MTRWDALHLILVLTAFSGCAEEDKYEARQARLEGALENNRDGFGSEPAWLVKVLSLAPDDRTAVFFGYGDNFEACSEFADAMNDVDQGVRYTCALAAK